MSTGCRGYRHPAEPARARENIRETAYRRGYTSGVFAAIKALHGGASIGELFAWAHACAGWRDSMEAGPPPEMPGGRIHAETNNIRAIT